jgi:hypothetical protein
MSIKVMHEQKENRRTGNIEGETIYFESSGWWGSGPLSFRRRYGSWSMSTTSGGQSQGIDVLDQIREMKAMLDYAESAILEYRAVEQEYDGLEIVE